MLSLLKSLISNYFGKPRKAGLDEACSKSGEKRVVVLPGPKSDGIDDTGERFLPNRRLSDIAFEHFHRYMLGAKLAAGKRVLDVACGQGYGTALLAHFGEQVVGVDVSFDAVRCARRNYARENLGFVRGNANSLPFPDAVFDLVISFETIEHVKEPVEFLRELRRVLRPDGILIVSTPDRDVYAKTRGNEPNPYHLAEMSTEEFAGALKSAFPHVVLYGQRVTLGSLVWPLKNGVAGNIEFQKTNFQFEKLEFTGDPMPVYVLAVASSETLELWSTVILEVNNFFNPLASIAGGMEDRDREIGRLRAEVQKLSSEK